MTVFPSQQAANRFSPLDTDTADSWAGQAAERQVIRRPASGVGDPDALEMRVGQTLVAVLVSEEGRVRINDELGATPYTFASMEGALVFLDTIIVGRHAFGGGHVAAGIAGIASLLFW